MALNQEVWLRTIVENLYPDNSFAIKSIDDSSHVSFRKVHIPNAGSPSRVVKNREDIPASNVGKRTDFELEYKIDEFTSDPIYISDIEKVELSYDKRVSVLHNDREELYRVAHISLLESWAKGAGNIVKTTGEAINAHTHDGATGKRKAITRNDVLGLMTLFNKQELPLQGRYLLLDAEMYATLLGSISESDKIAFFASADAQKGIVGQLYGINIMTRSTVLRLKNDYETLLFEGESYEATECAGALAWHHSCVSRALGQVKFFDNTNDPTYYGDVYSFLVRSGGSHRRHDKKGVFILVEDTVS